MTDALSRAGRFYVSCVIGTGIVVVGLSLVALWKSPVSYHWFVLACLTLLSGSFTIRIPTIPARLSVSETFVFAAVLLFGPEAATIIVVLDTLIISLWLDPPFRQPRRVLFNVAAPAVAIWVAARLFYALAGIAPLAHAPQQILGLVLPLFATALCYFILNSALVAVAVAFEKQTTAFLVWRQNFLWLSLNYFSGASVAALLLPYLQSPDSPFVRIIGVILPILLISYLTFKTALGRVEDANSHLRELNKLYLSTIETLAMAIDAKDQITHGHIRRVQIYAVHLAKAMGVTDSAQIRAIEAAALLHDMGKLAVPEYILNKPGPLTPAEFEKMKLHASVGADILSAIQFPYPVVPIVRHHHENWDGTGYPAGLGGSDIPIGARILSVVDCFDALTSDRPYRPRLSDREAMRILSERRGTMYDPLVVDTFLAIHTQLKALGEALPHVPTMLTINESTKPASQQSASRARLEQIAASRAETMALLQLAQDLGAAAEPHDVAIVALNHIRRLIPTSQALIFLKDEAADALKVIANVGDNSSVAAQLSIRIGRQLTGWVAANRQTIRNSDAILDFGEAVRSMSPRPRSAMATSIATDELLGVLSLYSTEANAFTEDHERIAEAVAHHIAKPLHSALLQQRATAATPSIVTFSSSSVAELPAHPAAIYVLAECSSETNPDSVSQLVLTAIRDCVRPGDVVVRVAADEYAVFISETKPQTASSTAERIRIAVEIACRSVAHATLHRVAATFAVSPEDGPTPELLLAVAKRRAIDSTSGRQPSKGSSVH